MVWGANIVLWLLLFYSSSAEEEGIKTGVKDKYRGQRPVKSTLWDTRIPSPCAGTVGPSLAYGVRLCPQLVDEDIDATDWPTPAVQTVHNRMMP